MRPADRLPPHSIESEQGVLGCCITSPNDCIGECVKKFKAGADVFYDLRHQTIFSSLAEMFDERKAIDAITLQQVLRDKQVLEQVGGMVYILSLPDMVPSTANLPYYADEVFKKYILRQMIHACTAVVSDVYECAGDVDELLDKAERDVLAVNRLRSSGNHVELKEMVKDALSNIERLWATNGAISGTSTGFTDLDRKVDGLHAGEMIVIAGYPGAGKTAIALNIAEHQTCDLKLPVGLFSMEMKAASLLSRIIYARSRINSYDVRSHSISERDFTRIASAASRIAASKLFIDDTSDLSIYELRARARRMQQEHGIKLLIIDYLQLLNAAGGSRKVESRQQEVADISRGIKGLAQELDIPVLVLSQLNDDGKLRESRAIGQDADGVWRLKKKEGGEDTPQRTEIELDVMKNRNGEVGCINLLFEKIYTKFQSVSKIQE